MKLIFKWTVWLSFFTLFTGCTKFCSKKQTEKPPSVEQAPVVATPNYAGIKVNHVVSRELVVGKGPVAKDTGHLKIRYSEWVYDPAALANQGPKIFDNKGEIRTIKLGANEIIKGLEEGLKGMRKGGKRSLIIPPEKAYGEQGQPPKVPPKAIVLVEVELVEVE